MMMAKSLAAVLLLVATRSISSNADSCVNEASPECADRADVLLQRAVQDSSILSDVNTASSQGANAEAKAKAFAAITKRGSVDGDTEQKALTEADVTPLEYCSREKLVNMHGARIAIANLTDAEADDFAYKNSSQTLVEEAILKDLENEMVNNNVDQMAKDIFSFYICVRWVPDETFWSVAMQEMQSEILSTVVEHSEAPNQAIGELYQNFKFIPILCSRNVGVYEEKDPGTYTYYRNFEERVNTLVNFFEDKQPKQVWQGLKHADESFCDLGSMNSHACDASLEVNSWINKASAWFGSWVATDLAEKHDKWAVLQDIFQNFKYRTDPVDEEWNTDFGAWKQLFPYHSFIGKAAGVPISLSPRSTERFMVCFGKRVASEMHRRPAGTNIITDQNSVGCHGWWEPAALEKMLRRMVKLWRPPTCQLASKTYEMKKAILKMFQKMNEDLFDALPSMLQDEQLYEDGTLADAIAGEPAYDVQSVVGSDGVTYFEGTRVARLGDSGSIPHGDAGDLYITNNKLQVIWESDHHDPKQKTDVDPSDFHVVPKDYKKLEKGILDTALSWGGAAVHHSLQFFVNSMFSSQQSNLAEMMSGSMTKWVVCGVAENASYEELDKWLGTEDEAFQEHVREAYAKWTGYKKAIPGEQCTTNSDLLPEDRFPGCQVCDFSELHEDHPEKYFHADDSQEGFMCPLVPPLGAEEQLQIFKEKSGMCLLHMTENLKRQFQWYYQGHHPARTQEINKSNDPRETYQLTKLLDISSSPGPQQVSFGRTCTTEEYVANPRFCNQPELQQKWPSVEDMASEVSDMLSGALGMPVGAVTDIIDNYQKIMGTQEENKSTEEKLHSAATILGEKGYDALLGIGRYAHSVAVSTHSELTNALPGKDHRHARLESEMFGYSHSGDFLHGSSYQYPIGSSGTTSNSRDRYQRYAVVCPCNDFDPGLEFALRWEWSELALRAMREAAEHSKHLNGTSRILQQVSPRVEVRSEARLFWYPNEQEGNRTFFSYGAAIRGTTAEGEMLSAEGPKVKNYECSLEYCSYCVGHHGYSCEPEEFCELGPEDSRRRRSDSRRRWGGDWEGRRRDTYSSCPQKPNLPVEIDRSHEWKVVTDGLLSKAVGGSPVGQVDHKDLKALTFHYHCGKKSDFGAAVSSFPTTASQVSFKECLENGVKSNAQLHAQEPWRLYHADEVVVVAFFGTLESKSCIYAGDDDTVKSLICDGASEAEGLDLHLGDAEKTSSTGAHYRGTRTGVGFPNGAVTEIVMKPEDVLQSLRGDNLVPASR